MNTFYMKREKNVERVLQWANSQGCSLAYDAIASYAAHRGLDFKIDYQDIITYTPKAEKKVKA